MSTERVNPASQTLPDGGAFAVFRSLDEIPAGFGPTVAAVGNFDGVHKGHRAILAAVAADARETSARAVAITFDPHPEQFLRPAQAPKLITLLPERLRLLAETGIDAVLVLRFDRELAGLSAREFAQRILVAALGVRGMHEGQNFRFGHGATAGVNELAAMGGECTGWRFRARLFARWFPQATCGGRDGCSGGPSLCSRHRLRGAASARGCWCPR
jgi:hypothetical protein